MDDLYIERVEKCLIAYSKKNNPCCAGCAHWQWVNAGIGECLKSDLMSGKDRVSLLWDWTSNNNLKAGHLLTPRGYKCGNFEDDKIDGFTWTVISEAKK